MLVSEDIDPIRLQLALLQFRSELGKQQQEDAQLSKRLTPSQRLDRDRESVSRIINAYLTIVP